MEADIAENEFRQNETIRTRSPATGNRQVSGPGIDFRGDSILEGPRSMAQMGADHDDRMQRNTAR